MIKVWFNHWFSTAYTLIELIKKDEKNQIKVIGSNSNIDSVIKLVCDEWYEEPDLKGDDYIDFCLKFCKDHGLNVFVPRKEMVNISKNKHLFENIGVKIMLDDYEKISLLNDKIKTYKLLENVKEVNIPPYFLVNNVDEFVRAYEDLSKDFESICMKFVKDEGAKSFRRIIKDVEKFESLKSYPSFKIGYNEAMEIFKTKENFDDLMVMPYLDGFEISVDCLKTHKGTIAIPRIKSNTRAEKISFDEKIVKMSQTIMEKLDLNCPCNIQFKLKEEKPYLLEINTRMSGGLQMSCLACNVNIPNLALNKLLGNDMDFKIDFGEKKVSYIEIPKIL